jgi:formyltetrahydrofolate deformylase
VSRVTGLLFKAGANIREAAQFEDEETSVFFMRVLFTLGEKTRDAMVDPPIGCTPQCPAARIEV